MNELNVELRDNQIIITVPREWVGSVGLNDRSDANALGAAIQNAVRTFFGSTAAATIKPSVDVDAPLSTRAAAPSRSKV